VGVRNPHFDSLVLKARDRVLWLITLVIFPAMVTGFLAFRGIIALFGQISAQKRDIARTNQDLENTLAELRHVQKNLVETERLSTLGKLTATVSRELRNPMAVLRKSLIHIRQCLTEPDKVLANLERAENSIVRCDTIIGDLLEHTRNRSIEVKPFDLSQWMLSVVAEQIFPPDTGEVLDSLENR
jgi:signal transduction histidine kinase